MPVVLRDHTLKFLIAEGPRLDNEQLRGLSPLAKAARLNQAGEGFSMSMPMRSGGAGLMLTAGILGAAAALYDYFAPATGIDHTGGVILVLVSCLLMALAAVAVLAIRPGALAGILIFLIILDILGTGTAAWFLESGLVMGAMAIAAAGALRRLASSRAAQ